MSTVENGINHNSSSGEDNKQNLLVPANIGLIGYGIVGQATAYGFSKASGGIDNIRYYDKFKDSLSPEEVVGESEFIFIALPTPMKEDESGIDLAIVEEGVDLIAPMTEGTDKIVIIKSTVTPGTTRRLSQRHEGTNFCFNPEFLTEANYMEDFLNAEMTIVGADNDLTSRRVSSLYRQRFLNTTIYQTDPTSAEAVKYFRNTFLPAKVIFANMFKDYCDAIGISYEEVKRMAAVDPRIVDRHLDVTSQRGFGGKCFPKDIVALIGEFHNTGIDASFLETVWDINKRIRQVYDWEEIPFAVSHDNRAEAS